MDCNKFREHIDDFVDNDISNALKSAMLSHARICPECKKELDDMQKMIDCMNSLPAISVPDDFLAKLNERIDSENAMLKTQSQSKYKKIFNYRTYSALAACVLLFVIVKADIPDMLNKSNGMEQSIVSVIPENNKRNITENTTDGVVADTSSDIEEIIPTPEVTPTAMITDTATAKPVSKTVKKATVPAKKPVTTATVAPVAPQPTKAVTDEATKETIQGTDNPAETSIPELKTTQTEKAVPTPAAAPASALSLTDEATEESQTSDETSRTSGGKGGGGGSASSGGINSGGGSVSSSGSAGESAGGGAAINSTASSSSSASSAKSASYTVIIRCNDSASVLALLSNVGYTAKGGYYSISSANANRLFSILNSNGISYTRSNKNSSDNTTDIYLIVE